MDLLHQLMMFQKAVLAVALAEVLIGAENLGADS